MAQGTVYSVAETGWTRFEQDNPIFEYSSNWTIFSSSDPSGGSDMRSSVIGSTIKFGFTGTSIRVIAPKNNNVSSSLKIMIDGVEETFSENNSSLVWRVAVYEKTGLPNKNHSVVITANTTMLNIFDAVDLPNGENLIIYKDRYEESRLAIKNPSTSKVYSLDNKTLIHLPNTSDKNMILHGVEAGKEIKLDEAFDKMKFVKDASEVLGNGKIFTHVVNVSNAKINKIIL